MDEAYLEVGNRAASLKGGMMNIPHQGKTQRRAASQLEGYSCRGQAKQEEGELGTLCSPLMQLESMGTIGLLTPRILNSVYKKHVEI